MHKEDDKLVDISFFKTLLMITIVLCHSCSFFTGDWFSAYEPIYNAKYLSTFASFLGSFHTQGFTMASGYLFYYLYYNKNKYNNILQSIKKRFSRLMVPYFATSILWVIPMGIYFFHYSFKDIVINYLLMVSPSQLWYLVMLFVVFCFFLLIGKKIKINFKNLIIVYIISTIVGYGLSAFNIDFFQLSKSVKYILFFYFGGIIYNNKNKMNLKRGFASVLLIIFSYLLLYLIDIYDLKYSIYISKFIDPIISCLEIYALFYICKNIIQKSRINSKFYNYLEQNAFGIYLFHQQIIYFTIMIFNGLVHPIVQVVISFIISISISLIMSILLKKNRITKYLFGL